MNLWVKRTGQLLVAALLFASCEDDTFLLGFKNQANKFNVKYQDFLIGEGSIISTEPQITDNQTGTQRLLVGEDSDPVLGNIKASCFMEFLGEGSKLASKLDHNYVYDSITIQLHLDYYSYGLNGVESGKFKVHRITEPTPLSYTKDKSYTIPGTNQEILIKESNRYYSNTQVQFSSEIIGETRFEQIFLFQNKLKSIPVNINSDRLKTAKDTLVAIARLNDDFGLELFNLALNDIDNQFSNREKFRSKFKGLAIIPENCISLIGIHPTSAFSKVQLYYHSTKDNNVVDTLSRSFTFSGVSFHNLEATRNAGIPLPDENYVGNNSNNFRIIQNGIPLITKIDLTSFYDDFVDQISNRNIVINSAEIIIESVSNSQEYQPLPLLELRIMEETDSFKNYMTINQSIRDSLSKFYIFTDGKHYYVNSDYISGSTPFASSLLYNSTKGNYTGSVTLFIQNLFNNKYSQYKLPYLGLYPPTSRTGASGITTTGKSVDRTLFNKDNIKLRVYYTVPNNSNL